MHIIDGADGIDPSLFFDDDGKAYYTGTTRVNEADASYQAIWGSEIDLKEMKLAGERKILWRGAMWNSYAPEGPHLYKKDGWYYLMIAEGGTEHMHAVTISRCDTVLGAYEGYQGNPILTHRHLGKMYRSAMWAMLILWNFRTEAGIWSCWRPALWTAITRSLAGKRLSLL